MTDKETCPKCGRPKWDGVTWAKPGQCSAAVSADSHEEVLEAALDCTLAQLDSIQAEHETAGRHAGCRRNERVLMQKNGELQAACAEMRAALENTESWLDSLGDYRSGAGSVEGVMNDIGAALSSDAGKGWLSPEEAEQLRDMLHVAQCPNCDGSGAYPDRNGEPVQCEWCFYRAALKPANKEQDDGK